MQNNSRHHAFRWTLTCVCALLLLQIGGPSIVSVSFALFVLFLWLFVVPAIDRLFVPSVVLAGVMLINSLGYVADEDFASIVARSVRQWLCLVLILAPAYLNYFNRDIARIATSVSLGLQWALLLIVLYQFLQLSFGDAQKAFLPYTWYGSTAGDDNSEQRLTTLPSYWLEFGAERGLALREELVVRPTALYAEPSYVGFMSACALTTIMLVRAGRGADALSAVLAFSTCLLCGTTSGVVNCLVVLVTYRWEAIRRNLFLLPLLFGLASAVVALGGGDRIISAADAQEELSGFIRLVKPLYNISQLFIDGKLLGVPALVAQTYFPVFHDGINVGPGLDNGLFNLVIHYGLLSFWLLWLMLRFIGWKLFVVFLMLFQVNGSPLGYDKAVVFCALVFVSRLSEARGLSGVRHA